MLMKSIKTFVIFLVLLHRAAASLSRIVGGRIVEIEEFPYQLALRYNGLMICGAVIISRNVGLTAAHCIPRRGSYSLQAGSTYNDQDGVVIYVKQAIVHPYHNGVNQDYDIAILKFFKPLRYSDKIKPVNLPNQGKELPIGIKGYISGWGSMYWNYPHGSHELRAVEVPVINNKLCKNVYMDVVRITSRMFCAGYWQGGKDSCQGDSGGPFVVNGTLYGLVSWGINCAQPGYPGVYTKISALRKFIRDNSGV